MMKLIFFTFLISTAFAGSAQFKIAGKYYDFIEKDKLLVSVNCKDSCVAVTKARSIKKKIIPKKKKFASSIGSYACTDILKGQSLLGIKKNKDMVAVCFFEKDSSMIDINSLSKFVEAL